MYVRMKKSMLPFLLSFLPARAPRTQPPRTNRMTRCRTFCSDGRGCSLQLPSSNQNKRVHRFLEKYFSTGRGAFAGALHPFDPVCTNLIIENIYEEIQPWMCRRVDKTDCQQLPLLERATALNRLMMAHCFEVILTRECPFSKYEMTSTEDEICLPAICAIIDRAKQYDARSFVIGTLQYRKLDSLSKILDVSPENIFMNVMSCRNKLSGTDTSTPYMENRKKSDISVTLVGISSYSSTIFPLTLGVTKAIQVLENDDDTTHVWPIICYDANDIKDKSIYSNIIQTSSDSNFYIGGAIHIVLNEVEEEISMKQEKENQCKFLKIFADFLKAPIVHVKADDVDSVINVMHLVADFKNSHKRDIVVNLIVNQTECYPIKQLTLPELMEELITQEKPPLAAAYMKHLVANKVISKISYEKRRDEFLTGIQELYSRQDFVVIEDKNASSEHKSTAEPPTASTTAVLNTIGEAISKAPSNTKLSTEDSKHFEERESQLKENKLKWSTCELLAYGTLLQEETNIHVCTTKKNKKAALIITDSATGRDINLLSNIFPYMGNYTACTSNIPEYTMAGFEMGYSSVTTNTLNIWMAPENLQSCVLQSILKHYLLYIIKNTPLRVTFIIPDYNFVFEKNTRKYHSNQKRHILNIFYGMMDHKQKHNKSRCTIVNLSSPANYFHILRKQAKTPKMGPLVAFVPHMYGSSVECFSTIEDLSGESGFQPFLHDSNERDDPEVKHVILCTGKIYHDLIIERNNRNLTRKIAIGRIEQIYPLPMENILEYLGKFKKAKIWWAQQEQYEDGWWTFVQQSLKEENVRLKYAGRCHATRPDYVSADLSDAELSYIFESIIQNI